MSRTQPSPHGEDQQWWDDLPNPEFESAATGQGRLVKHVRSDAHVCQPPGVWQRWRQRIGYGSIWECRCGQQWEWSSSWAESLWIKL